MGVYVSEDNESLTHLHVEDKFDRDGDLEFAIYDSDFLVGYHNVYVSMEKVKELHKHLGKLLEDYEDDN